MRQRLGIAQAILTEPELLVLDEPTSGLDVEGTRDTLRFLRRLCNEAGVTIVFSSHQMQEVEALCDRVAILNEGGLVACEEKEALLSWDRSEVDLLVDRPEEAAAQLAELNWIVSIDPRPGGLHVHLQGPRSDELAAWLVGHGFRVSGVVPHRRTLEDYFLRVTEP
jgi:ABC-2 type transport system ATP-binding protein